MRTEDWIDGYFLNELTPEENTEFERMLSADDDFRKEFEFQKDLVLAVRSHEKDILKSKLRNHEQALKEGKKTNWSKWLVAASILILMGTAGLLYSSLSRPDYNELYAQNYEIYPNTEFNITRSESNPSPEYNAFVAYESGNYQNAILIFSELQKAKSSEYIKFYLAQSYLAINENEKALSRFEEIIENNKDFVGESYWFAALSALKLNNKDLVKKYLNYLIANDGYKSRQAKLLLKDLD